MERTHKWPAEETEYLQFLNHSGWQNQTDLEHNDVFHSELLIILVACYGVVIFGGVLGNSGLAVSLCLQQSGRIRNPLLVAQCLADLLVSGVSAPLTIILFSFTFKPWTLSLIGCKTIYFMQAMPVACSNICLFMLSLDRYATVKHPRIAQLRQTRCLPAILALGSWISACVICFPIFFIYKISFYGNTDPTCKPFYSSRELHIAFVIFHTVLVFIIPSIGVIINHLGVRKKLCALSLTARAAHGELPLPMPILRRPTHMIIVTGMANGIRGVVGNTDTNGDNNSIENMKSVPRTPRSMRKSRNKSKRTTPGPDLPLPQISTLRSRKRLANILVASSIIFAGCWTPYIICIFCFELKTTATYCPKTVSDFSLLLGYAHSAISPILFWALNHNTLRQSNCTFCSRFNSAQKFLRTHLRIPTAPPPPSSTNEAALGPFNPRYIKTRPQQVARPPASSHFLY